MSTDKLTTIIGMAKGVIVAALDYLVTMNADGSINLKSPIFWAGMGFAVLEALKGYYTAGVKP